MMPPTQQKQTTSESVPRSLGNQNMGPGIRKVG